MSKNKLLADIYCIEPIPCNPCETSCPFGAITIGENITNLPVVNEDLCRGCGICLAICPGLAIRLLQEEYKDGTSLVAFPYEYEPLPEKGDLVQPVDMQGKVLGEGTVIKLQKPLKDDPTRLVYVEVSREIAREVRSIKRLKKEKVEEDIIVCRCEEIGMKEILAAIEKGDRSLNAIKRRTRAGMGLCQGKTCSKLISRMISEETGLKANEIDPSSKRQPVNPITLGTLASTAEHPLIQDLDELKRELES
ncbi:(2Fe-2S)-binding protein [Clostridia bacterium]|nr:(2Fe-2S)-binding protein [Clostridia bacterium]